MADYTSIHSGTEIDAGITNIGTHIVNVANPHGVTATQVGLGNCNNTADLDKPISTATQTALNNKSQVVWRTH